MEFDQLRYFRCLARTGNFTRAAEEMGISQPALSRSIQRLEEELGVPVVIRKTKSVELTEAGRTLAAKADQILKILDDARAEIGDDGKTGRVRVGAIPTIAPFFLPKFLKAFADEYPDACVEIYEERTADLLQLCTQGDVDVAILALPIQDKHLESRRLFDEELFLALPKRHPLARRKQVRLKDLEGEPFVMLAEAHCLSENILAFCRQRSFQPVVVGRTNQLAMVQELVALSHGISLIPAMARHLDRGKSRVYRSLASPVPKRSIALAWDPYRFQSRLVINFRQRLEAFCGECSMTSDQ